MALYTPAPQREGLDWLAGLVRSGQNLWQNERQLQQAQQRLQLARKQQEIQTQEFWAKQKSLKRQEDFQDRKFLYDMSKDARDEKRRGVLDERSWLATQRDDARMEKDLDWRMAPGNPVNRENAADAKLKEQEVEFNNAPPFSDLQMPTDEGEGVTDALLPENIEPGQVKKTGNPTMPFLGKDYAGQLYGTMVGGYDKRGRPSYYTNRSLAPKGKAAADPLDAEINTYQDNLSSLSAKLKVAPPFPSGAEVPPEAKTAYESRKAETEANNAPVREQITQISKRLNDAETKRRLRDTPLTLNSVTPEFEKEVGGEIQSALKAKSPAALRSVRPKVEDLALKGDASAVQALKFLDDVLGKPAVAPVKKTGYY